MKNYLGEIMELENLKEYKEWLKELKEKLLKAQIKASVAVNKELHNFYWNWVQI